MELVTRRKTEIQDCACSLCQMITPWRSSSSLVRASPLMFFFRGSVRLSAVQIKIQSHSHNNNYNSKLVSIFLHKKEHEFQGLNFYLQTSLFVPKLYYLFSQKE